MRANVLRCLSIVACSAMACTGTVDSPGNNRSVDEAPSSNANNSNSNNNSTNNNSNDDPGQVVDWIDSQRLAERWATEDGVVFDYNVDGVSNEIDQQLVRDAAEPRRVVSLIDAFDPTPNGYATTADPSRYSTDIELVGGINAVRGGLLGGNRHFERSNLPGQLKPGTLVWVLADRKNVLTPMSLFASDNSELAVLRYFSSDEGWRFTTADSTGDVDSADFGHDPDGSDSDQLMVFVVRHDGTTATAWLNGAILGEATVSDGMNLEAIDTLTLFGARHTTTGGIYGSDRAALVRAAYLPGVLDDAELSALNESLNDKYAPRPVASPVDLNEMTAPVNMTLVAMADFGDVSSYAVNTGNAISALTDPHDSQPWTINGSSGNLVRKQLSHEWGNSAYASVRGDASITRSLSQPITEDFAVVMAVLLEPQDANTVPVRLHGGSVDLELQIDLTEARNEYAAPIRVNGVAFDEIIPGVTVDGSNGFYDERGVFPNYAQYIVLTVRGMDGKVHVDVMGDPSNRMDLPAGWNGATHVTFGNDAAGQKPIGGILRAAAVYSGCNVDEVVLPERAISEGSRVVSAFTKGFSQPADRAISGWFRTHPRPATPERVLIGTGASAGNGYDLAYDTLDAFLTDVENTLRNTGKWLQVTLKNESHDCGSRFRPIEGLYVDIDTEGGAMVGITHNNGAIDGSDSITKGAFTVGVQDRNPATLSLRNMRFWGLTAAVGESNTAAVVEQYGIVRGRRLYFDTIATEGITARGGLGRIYLEQTTMRNSGGSGGKAHNAYVHGITIWLKNVLSFNASLGHSIKIGRRLGPSTYMENIIAVALRTPPENPWSRYSVAGASSQSVIDFNMTANGFAKNVIAGYADIDALNVGGSWYPNGPVITLGTAHGGNGNWTPFVYHRWFNTMVIDLNRNSGQPGANTSFFRIGAGTLGWVFDVFGNRIEEQIFLDGCAWSYSPGDTDPVANNGWGRNASNGRPIPAGNITNSTMDAALSNPDADDFTPTTAHGPSGVFIDHTGTSRSITDLSWVLPTYDGMPPE